MASCVGLAALAAPGGARADVAPEVELVAGASHNLGGEDTGYFFGTSYLIGLRGVAYLDAAPEARWRLGAELALDVMHYDWMPETASGVPHPVSTGSLNVYLHETAIDVEGLVTVGVAF